jgi:hypothetical protein
MKFGVDSTRFVSALIWNGHLPGIRERGIIVNQSDRSELHREMYDVEQRARVACRKDAENPAKPCPFCGRAVQIQFKNGNYGYSPNSVSIGCESCNVWFGEDAERWEHGKGTYSIREEAEERLLTRWNTRATPGNS